jgi:hypothetical protein
MQFVEFTVRSIGPEFADLLVAKNTSYDSSAFKDVWYAGRLIKAMETLDIRITDKIRRLQSTDPNFNGEDVEFDLAGYLILKQALKKWLNGKGYVAGGTYIPEPGETVAPLEMPKDDFVRIVDAALSGMISEEVTD